MKQATRSLATGLLLSLTLTATATTLYVDVNNPAPAAPYTNWVTAATNIQDAVDAAVDGDQVWVTDGVYEAGARAMAGMSNRVAVTKALTVQSVNGPAVTVIRGHGPMGTAAVRCAYLTNGAVLAGFTLTNGATQFSSGGGVWCESQSAVVSNCVLVGNSAYSHGAGAYSGSLYNCTLSGNSGNGAYSSTLNNCTLAGNRAGNGGGADSCTLNNCILNGNSASGAGGGSGGDGGGAYNSTLNNCTLTGNSATFYANGVNGAGRGGGAFGGMLNNCIIYYSPLGGNYSGGTLNYCCTTPLPAGGTRNTNAEPALASVSHLSASSPCRGAGSAAYASGVDIDGEPWANPPSIGCDEYWSGSVTGIVSAAIVVSYTNVPVGFSVDFQAVIGGRVSASSWDFGDGVVVSNRPYASHAWVAAGDYTVALRAYNESYPDGVAASVIIHVVREHYVALSSVAPMWPYGSWATAATNIQDAVDAASGLAKLVWVSNGVYEVGARAVYGMTNRVAVTNAMTVQSVNGPGVTFIKGNGLYGPQAIRCVYLFSNAVLAGFTLTNGATQSTGDAYNRQQAGGGVWCESRTAVVSNCVLIGNSGLYGGGAYNTTLTSCVLCSNTAAMYGGGARECTMHRSMIVSNVALYDGGGVWASTLNNCLVARNTAGRSGGGVYGDGGALRNCTVTGNSAPNAGGACRSILYNCIVYDNTATNGNWYLGTWDHCCTTPNPGSGSGNFSAAPLFVNPAANDFHLQANSPCINTGNNANTSGTNDLGGQPRIDSGTVDVGAYEFQSYATFLAWLQSYGLPANGSANCADSDGDRMNNWQEWLAGTNPTNAASVLRLQSTVVQPAGVTLTWSSVTNRAYFVQRATNLMPQSAFALLQTNIPGLPDTTSFTDTNPPASGPAFYRVGVQP